MTDGNNPYDVSDETGLINSNRTAGEAVSISREIKGSLEYQQSRLDVQICLMIEHRRQAQQLLWLAKPQ
jgi:hypothetical protein